MKPLGTLLSDSFSFFQKHFMVLLVGAVVFGLLNGWVGSYMDIQGKKFATNMMQDMGAGNMMNENNIQKMQDLTMKAMQGDADAAMELEKMGESMEAMAGEMEQKMRNMKMPTAETIGGFAGMLGKGMLLSMLISTLAAAYFLSVTVLNATSVGGAVSLAGAHIVKVFLLSIWIMIRTFVWIPFVGIVTGIILGPRFITAPINLLEGKKGVMESASMSYTQTTGQWGKIFGNMIAVAIVLWIAVMIVAMVLGMFGTIGTWVTAILVQLGSAFMMVFGIHLARTVMAK
ncbi:MAG: hypothetical protein ABL890_00320 [Candidatus Peribacteraceae bacterium]